MIVAGIGCRKGTAAVAIEAAINAALARAGLAADALALIATSAAKQKEPGIADAAAIVGVRVVNRAEGVRVGGEGRGEVGESRCQR